MARQDLQKTWKLWQEKLTRLRKARVIEAAEAIKFQLDKQIEETEIELAKLERVLTAPTSAQLPETPELQRYAQHLIAHNQYLPQQGIHAGGKPVTIELEKIFITLRTLRERTVRVGEDGLDEEAGRAPGERAKMEDRTRTETVSVPVPEVLGERRRLAILGDPGSGKTTLLQYLTLLYAKDLVKPGGNVPARLGLDESGYLPILLYLRQVGVFLHKNYPADDTCDGHGLLFDLLRETLTSHRAEMPEDFFEAALREGRAVVLLDGLDEVADPGLQRRVVKLVECLVKAYPKARYIVTCRVVSYKDDARLQEQFDLASIQDFSLADVEQFLTHWHRQIAHSLIENPAGAEAQAGNQTRDLLAAIKANPSILALAINPLMLTVIALVHREQVKLPDRRSDLYEVVIKALLETRDEARNIQLPAILPDGGSIGVEVRLNVLQELALYMHNAEQKDIEKADLREFLTTRYFKEMVGKKIEAQAAADRFLHIIMERTGLLIARSQTLFSFSHLTFQEYLAGRAMTDQDDPTAYILARTANPWWREAILLAAGYLADGGPKRPSRLIRAIAGQTEEPARFHNRILAAECVRDVTSGRVEPALIRDLKAQLWQAVAAPLPLADQNTDALKAMINRKAAVTEALAWLDAGYWRPPYGEPEWAQIPAGRFMMGSDDSDKEAYAREKPQHPVKLSAYAIAKTPVTNAQYEIFVKATGQTAPQHWTDGKPPKGKDSHPVTYVSWEDASAYCQWLRQMTGRDIRLPTEAEWERAARGADGRRYPWGNEFEIGRCNNDSLGLRDTSPVGIFLNGASPEGLLDLSGNVYEWCLDWFSGEYYAECLGKGILENPTGPADGSNRVIRGGSWFYDGQSFRSAFRNLNSPGHRDYSVGFRLVFVP